MTHATHWRGLERAYLGAPINTLYQPSITIHEGVASIRIELSEKLHHPAFAVHGSVYFKMLDDAAFFAANSLEPEVFLLTTAFTTYLTRPISAGYMRAEGRVVCQSRTQMIAEAVVSNADGREVGRGSGLFVRSQIRLQDVPGYLDDPAA